MYDLWFLLEKGVVFDEKLIVKKLAHVGITYDKDKLFRKILTFSPTQLAHDLNQFLPRSQRALIGDLKNRLLVKLKAVTA